MIRRLFMHFRSKSFRQVKELTATCLLIGMSTAWGQGAGCDEGVIRLPDRNGTIQICSALAAQVPQLSKQLADATRTLGDQQAQMRELMRLVRGLNGASQNLGADRQATLLRNLSAELARSQRGGDPQVRRAFESLSEQLDTLREQMLAAMSSQASAAAAITAIQGSVGDSIARLEFGSAVRQLDEITMRLKALQEQVGDVKNDTQAIRSQVQRIEERDLADRKVNEEQMRQVAEAPDSLLSVRLQLATPPKIAGLPPINSLLQYSFYATNTALTWQGSDLVLMFAQRGGAGFHVDATKLLDQRRVGGNQSFTLQFIEPDGDFGICLTVFDPLRKRRVTWVQEYTIDNKARSPTASPVRPPEIVLDGGELRCIKPGFKRSPLEAILPQQPRAEVEGLADPERYFNFNPTISRNANLRQGLWLIALYPGYIPGPQPFQVRLVFSGTGPARVLDLEQVYGSARNAGEHVRVLVDSMDHRELTVCVVGPNPVDATQSVRYVRTHSVSILPISSTFQTVELLRKGAPRLAPANQPAPECDPPSARKLPLLQAGR